MNSRLKDIILQHRESIYSAMEQLENYFSSDQAVHEEMFRRALFDVRNNHVQISKYDSFNNIFYFSIQDVQSITGYFNLDENKLYSNCNERGVCRHQISVTFYLYQHIDSLSDWISRWKSSSAPQLITIERRTPESWTAFVDFHTNRFVRSINWDDIYSFPYRFEELTKKIQKNMPIEREWKPLYNFYTTARLLENLWPSLPKKTHYYIKQTLDEAIEELDGLLVSLQSANRLFAFDPFFEEIRQIIRRLCQMDGLILLERHYLYINFMSIVANKKENLEEEQAFLEGHNSFLSRLNYAAVSILLNDHSSFDKALSFIQASQLEEWKHVATFVLKNGTTEQFELIMNKISDHLEQFMATTLSEWQRTHFVSELYDLYRKIDLSDEQWNRLFQLFGKNGFRPYTQYLLNQKLYREWVALHQQYNSSLEFAESCGMSQVLAEAPNELLPFYHFIAMKEVQFRTRENYKQAVRVWKKMKSAAKKANKMDFWESYVTEIQQRFKRLRALQEEMQKGSLAK